MTHQSTSVHSRYPGDRWGRQFRPSRDSGDDPSQLVPSCLGFAMRLFFEDAGFYQEASRRA